MRFLMRSKNKTRVPGNETYETFLITLACVLRFALVPAGLIAATMYQR